MRARLITNPIAGRGKTERALHKITEYFKEKKISLEVSATSELTHGTQLAKEAAAQGFDMVIVAGGDGTLNEVANGLAGSHIPLGIIPLGTGNVFARGLKIPLRVEEACRVICEGELRRIDLGKACPPVAGGQARERYFLGMASVGFDAQAVYELELKAKRILGSWAYVLSCFRTALKYRSVSLTMRIHLNQKSIFVPAWVVVIGNVSAYAWVLKPTHLARVDDGLLDICIFGFTNFIGMLRQILGVFIGRHILYPEVRYKRARVITIDSTPSVPVQVDGEVIGKTPMKFRVVPKCLSVIVPRMSHL